MEALLKGMTQLQAAMTMQLGMADTKPETIRPGTTGAELPKLTEADEYAAINVGDWLHGLSGPMGDLTDGSSVWWTETTLSLKRTRNPDTCAVCSLDSPTTSTLGSLPELQALHHLHAVLALGTPCRLCPTQPAA